MAKGKIAIATLCVMLVTSNVWWTYNSLDAGITATYTSDSLRDASIALAQSKAVVMAVSAPGATRESIVAAAQAAGTPSEPFEKDGVLWVDRIGLKFDDSGRLLDIVT